MCPKGTGGFGRPRVSTKESEVPREQHNHSQKLPENQWKNAHVGEGGSEGKRGG